MKAYKVVVLNKGALVSSMPVWSIHYPIGKWIQPEVGKLFVFTKLKDARKYAGKGLLIYTCAVEGLEPIYHVAAQYWKYNDFWHGREVETKPAPTGSHVATRVKLLRRVE